MDGYESMHEKNKREAAARKEREARENAEYEAEQSRRAADNAARRADEQARYAQSLRYERDELLESNAAEVQDLEEQIERLRKEKAVIVNALRPLVELLNAQPPSSLEYFIGAPLKKAVREAAELLSVIDGQKTTTKPEAPGG